MTYPSRRCALALALSFGGAFRASAGPTQLIFNLPAVATTSAGVYDLQGRLLRTLWRAEVLTAGEHQRTWDGLGDDGRSVADGEQVDVRLIHHRVAYVWEGVVGNSSAVAGGARAHKAFLPPASLAATGDRLYYATGYNEGQPGLHSFTLAQPGLDQPLPQSTDAFTSHGLVAADATRLYWANTGGLSPSTFVGVHDIASARRGTFTAGVAVCLNLRQGSTACYEDQQYPSVIDLNRDADDTPTGLAVQRDGRLLAVAHGGKNLVRLFDKSSGVLLRQMSLPLAPKSLNQIAMARDGDLWVISGNAVLRYTDLERSPRIAARIDGLTMPIALAASPAHDGGLWVAEGGASQQLRRFDREGVGRAVIGQRGGYNHAPEVTDGKLCFMARGGRQQTGLVVTPDESLWVVDYCNNRMLRFRPGNTDPVASDAQVAYLPASYRTTVDHANPRRIFANFLEFDVDPDAPLALGLSWTLRRNWLGGLPPSLLDAHAFNGGFGGFLAVETLANGRTYGLVSAQGRQVLVELPPSGPLRVVRALASPGQGATAKVLYENGDLGYAMTGATKQSAMRLPLIGFDAAGDPIWATEPVRLASVPTSAGSPWYRGAFSGLPPRFPVTGAGHVVFFDQSVRGNEGFHLGAAADEGADWLWQASPSGALDGKGTFQTAAVDRSVTYGGNVVWASGRDIVFGYHGEFYKDMRNGRVGQANQFMHFDESGLFIGQFGQPSTQPAPEPQPGLSGNAFSPTLVRHGGRLYLYHNDESAHGGVHRWRIDGTDSRGDLRGRGASGQTVELR